MRPIRARELSRSDRPVQGLSGGWRRGCVPANSPASFRREFIAWLPDRAYKPKVRTPTRLPAQPASLGMLDEADMTQRSVTPVATLRDDDGAINSDYVDRVMAAIAAADVTALRDLVGTLHAADVGALMQALEPEQRPQLIELMGLDFDFTALTEVDDSVREEILHELPAETVADGVRDIDSDDAVRILEDLPHDEQAEILEQMPAPDRVALAHSLIFPEGSAGRQMQTEYVAAAPAWTVGQAIDYLHETADLPERFYELYVVDASGRLLGAV